VAKRAAELAAYIALDPASGTPFYRQLYEGVRAEIPSGRLPVRVRLPSTRAMAAGLGVSRTTVVAAFDQLLAEGYP
jgi:GntR family transcriptional regulator / MocR family aminotransferase